MTPLPSQGGHDALYASPPPWDIGRPQPAMQSLADEGLIRGRVLDVGCGTGEHALMAAASGLDATGVDLSDAALEQARRKAGERGLTARFLRHDALRLDQLGERFDTVLDSLVFHGFAGDERTRYVEGLGSVLAPGGRYFVLCFRDEPPNRPGRVHRLAPSDLEAAFAGDGWHVDAIEPVIVATVLPSLPTGIRGWRAAITRR